MKNRGLFAVVTFLFLYAIPLFAQCGLYSYSDLYSDSSTAVMHNSTQVTGYRCTAYAEAHVSVPSGNHSDRSASGISYAEAVAQVSTVGEVGEGLFWGYNKAASDCWDYPPYSSFSQPFRLNDPTPNITGVSPNPWNAGVPTTVHITGSGFGTLPSLSITVPNNDIVYTIISRNNTEIVANVTVAATSPGEDATITVTSAGFDGSGFVSNAGNSPSSPSRSIHVNPIPAPAPQIMFNGTNIANTTQSVVVGQQIILASSVNVAAGLRILTQSWTIPGTIVGGYTASTLSGRVEPITSFNGPTIKYYWVTPGQSFAVTFFYGLDNFQTSSATATFNIAGVTSPGMVVLNNGIFSINIFAGCAEQASAANLVFGNLAGSEPPCPPHTFTGTPGIQFVASGTGPGTGNFFFVQLLNSDTRTYVGNSPTKTCTNSQGLDTSYPYPQLAPNNASDAPFTLLPPDRITFSRSFDATMYLMWQSISSTFESIPVPVVFQRWQFTASTTQSNGVWGTPIGSSGGVGGVTPAAGIYPIWTNLSIATCP